MFTSAPAGVGVFTGAGIMIGIGVFVGAGVRLGGLSKYSCWFFSAKIIAGGRSIRGFSLGIYG